MSDSIVFVLHGEADDAFAAGLARALTPLPAFPARLSDHGALGAQFGFGAVCVVVWTRDTQVAPGDVLHAAPHGVILRLRGAPLPDEFAGAPFAIVEGEGDASADAERVRAAIASLGQARVQRGGRRRDGAPVARPASRLRKLAVRGVLGLAATVTLAGIASTLIGPHADATSADSSEAEDPATREPVPASDAPARNETETSQQAEAAGAPKRGAPAAETMAAKPPSEP